MPRAPPGMGPRARRCSQGPAQRRRALPPQKGGRNTGSPKGRSPSGRSPPRAACRWRQHGALTFPAGSRAFCHQTAASRPRPLRAPGHHMLAAGGGAGTAASSLPPPPGPAGPARPPAAGQPGEAGGGACGPGPRRGGGRWPRSHPGCWQRGGGGAGATGDEASEERRRAGRQEGREGGESGGRAGRSLFPETPLQGAAGVPPRAGRCSGCGAGTCASALPPAVSHGGAPAPSPHPGERGGGSN